MKQSALTCILAGAVFFLSGVIVGGQSKRDNLVRYERAYNLQALDWGLVQANLALLRQYATIPEGSPLQELPQVYFDQKTRKIVASAFVYGPYADKMPAESLKGGLMTAVGMSWLSVKTAFPTLPGDAATPGPDFYMEFFNISFSKGVLNESKETGKFPLFAEFKEGQLILHEGR
jgi:hypothetical protein